MIFPTLRGLCRSSRLLVLLAALPGAAWAQVTVTSSKATVVSDRTCILTASHADGRPRAWRWVVEEPYGGTLRPRADGRGMEYRAPLVLGPKIVHVRASTEGASGVLTLQVQPPPMSQAMGQAMALMPKVHASDWQVPQMTPFAGQLPGHEEGLGGTFQHLGGVERVDSEHLGPLGHTWLAWDSAGIWSIPGPGLMRRIPLKGQLAPGLPVHTDPATFPKVRCGAIAVQPGAKDPGRAVVVVLAEPSTWPAFVQRLCHLLPDGTLRPYPGLKKFNFHDKRVINMALDLRGNLTVLCEDNWIFRITPAGDVTYHTTSLGLKGRFLPYSHTWGHFMPSPFLRLNQLTVDPVSGDILVSDVRGGDEIRVDVDLRRISPGGAVHHVLIKEWEGKGSTPVRGRLDFVPGALRFHDGVLFMTDNFNASVWALDLESQLIAPLLERASGGAAPRFGPLRIFAQGLDPAAAAYAGRPTCLAVAKGQALLGTGPMGREGLVRLDLPEGSMAMPSREPVAGPVTPPVQAQPPAPAGPFTIESEGDRVLPSGWTWNLRAVPANGVQRRWKWTCEGLDLVPGPGGTVTAVAPEVKVRTTYNIVLEDEDNPGAWASWVVSVLPRLD